MGEDWRNFTRKIERSDIFIIKFKVRGEVYGLVLKSRITGLSTGKMILPYPYIERELESAKNERENLGYKPLRLLLPELDYISLRLEGIIPNDYFK